MCFWDHKGSFLSTPGINYYTDLVQLFLDRCRGRPLGGKATCCPRASSGKARAETQTSMPPTLPLPCLSHGVTVPIFVGEITRFSQNPPSHIQVPTKTQMPPLFSNFVCTDECISWLSMLTIILFLEHWDHGHCVSDAVLGALQILMHLLHITTLWGRCDYSSPLFIFTDEAQRVRTACQYYVVSGREIRELTTLGSGSRLPLLNHCAASLEGF